MTYIVEADGFDLAFSDVNSAHLFALGLAVGCDGAVTVTRAGALDLVLEVRYDRESSDFDYLISPDDGSYFVGRGLHFV